MRPGSICYVPACAQRVEYYAEEQFAGANLKRSVHIGWGATLGTCPLQLVYVKPADTDAGKVRRAQPRRLAPC